MPAVSMLKSSRAREKRALVKEEAEAQKLLQEHHSNNLEDVIRQLERYYLTWRQNFPELID